jgi:hypothetical protein
VRRGRRGLKPVEHLRQLPLKYLEFGNLLLNSTQLLCQQLMQTGTHRQTLSAVEFCCQGFKIGEGKP